MPLNKVFILTNPLNHEGGVVNYYNLFLKHFESNTVSLKHGSIGSRAFLFYYPILKRLLYPFFYLFDLLAYTLTLIFDRNIKIVQVSPSLIPVPLIRDGLLVVVAKLLGKKVVVFYRGWKLPTYHKIAESNRLRKLFNFVFQKNTLQVVLASSFKNDLVKLNPKKASNILITTTAIDKSEIVRGETLEESDSIKVLFLGRIQDLKGIEELIDAIITLNKTNQLEHFKFTIVGHENKTGYTNQLKEKLKGNNVPEGIVDFPGRVTGTDKFALYAANDIYILPSYTEGCPNSVLEALASGLFCITTRVGALSDLVVPGKNGLFVDVKNSESIVKSLQFCNDNKTYNENRIANSAYYCNAFDIREITNLFETKYLELIEKR
ncbi:glycosyltransferase family 4 protein [Winogradskyella psychrotolerans]|uniref:glycosyltransferase family 4 protein n=1 Tax=Winogradskyella psychrotolerans TaxID=1344585 RepID=UPI001C06F334|nr:glycosyltransferase family 4 protein [Winogradskyella psychrotolerans]MBU2922165.1 glycosyltransferase family 4 protein [Winogradskyella psychrotolerans]